MRLLFVEDDRSLCRAEKTILEKAGYSVDFVHNGEDALDYALEGNYDGIILELMDRMNETSDTMFCRHADLE